MSGEKPSWCVWSTPETVQNDVPSVTAILETVIAVPLYWWIALQVGTVLPLLISTVVAPLVLLRSDQSVALGLRWFQGFEASIIDAPILGYVDGLLSFVHISIFWIAGNGRPMDRSPYLSDHIYVAQRFNWGIGFRVYAFTHIFNTSSAPRMEFTTGSTCGCDRSGARCFTCQLCNPDRRDSYPLRPWHQSFAAQFPTSYFVLVPGAGTGPCSGAS